MQTSGDPGAGHQTRATSGSLECSIPIPGCGTKFLLPVFMCLSYKHSMTACIFGELFKKGF